MQPDLQCFCPQCGAPLAFRPAILSVACEYCSAVVVRQGNDPRLAGKASYVSDNGSPIVIYSQGKFRGTGFTVVGRLQLAYGRGTWNEWFLREDGQGPAWLSEAQGVFTYYTPANKENVLGIVPFEELVPGHAIQLAGQTLYACDIRKATYRSIEGELPVLCEEGSVFCAADFLDEAGHALTLDFGSGDSLAQLQVFSGRRVELAQLKLDRLREFSGWDQAEVLR